ncbi:hypothetical protein [Shewanella livingstonensis]|uniref:Uncharacterized protein n=1 Tax=Shewanella livingstonensis TaxID=150120 RepID=A0A3G8LUW7_9GAMM|nr:hypothetical protein [Shewanella livingstonensis]AZG73287.1 hypothetical protein EGC82_11240 [Shewanella livingstonensis]
MKIQSKTLIALLMIGMWGCGSDDKTVVALDQPVTDNPTTQTPAEGKVVNEAWNYIDSPYMEFGDSSLKGQVQLYVGRMEDNVQPWVSSALLRSFSGDLSGDMNGDGVINHRDSTLAGIKNVEAGPISYVQTEDMREYLATNPDGLGAGTSRPDIFVEGIYSHFDLLRFVVGTHDDLRFEGDIISYKDSAYDTYEFNLSWDQNQDGVFDEKDGEYYNSDDWHFAYENSRGQNTFYAGSRLDYTYRRMDQTWLREGQQVRFLPHHEAMTNRRHWIWKQEQDRLAASDGKFIIPILMHSGGAELTIPEFQAQRNPSPEIIATNVEVKAFNLRSDVWQPGHITSMDVWMSVAEQTGERYSFTWWPVMSSGAIVNNFSLMEHPYSGPYGGWMASIPYQGELVAALDFAMAPFPTCDFKLDGSPTAAGEGEIPQDICNQEWLSFQGIGGNNLSEVAGANLLSYPPEYMALVTLSATAFNNVDEIDMHYGDRDSKEMYVAKSELQFSTLNSLGDFDLYPTVDATQTARLRQVVAATKDTTVGNAKILDQTHFGWNISDCTQCHNENKQPLGHGGQSWPTNSADGFDYIQPYYCASCHGSNGASEGHNRGARCFWCHNTNNPDGLHMKNHGDASLAKFVPAEENVSNQRTASGQQLDFDGTEKPYDDLWFPSHNSDYNLSKTYPDPYSCTACHGVDKEPIEYVVE